MQYTHPEGPKGDSDKRSVGVYVCPVAIRCQGVPNQVRRICNPNPLCCTILQEASCRQKWYNSPPLGILLHAVFSHVSLVKVMENKQIYQGCQHKLIFSRSPFQCLGNKGILEDPVHIKSFISIFPIFYTLCTAKRFVYAAD